MSRPLVTATRSQLALQSYLDGLLQEAAVELADSVALDEFEAAVLEEQVRDAGVTPQAVAAPAQVEEVAQALVMPTVEMPVAQPLAEVLVAAPVAQTRSEPVPPQIIRSEERRVGKECRSR